MRRGVLQVYLRDRNLPMTTRGATRILIVTAQGLGRMPTC